MKNYLQEGLTRQEREQQQLDITELRPYILYLKKRDLVELQCEICGKKDCNFDIHHTSYKKDLTYYDLKLLCEECHKSITDYKHCKI